MAHFADLRYVSVGAGLCFGLLGIRGNGMQNTDLGAEQLLYTVAGQAQVAAAVFAGLCFGLLGMLVALVYRGLQRDEAEREAHRFEKHMRELANEPKPTHPLPHPHTPSRGASNRDTNRVSPELKVSEDKAAVAGFKITTISSTSLPQSPRAKAVLP